MRVTCVRKRCVLNYDLIDIVEIMLMKVCEYVAEGASTVFNEVRV